MCKRLKDYLILFILTSLLFTLYILLRGIHAPFVGPDSYYFLNFIFHNIKLSLTNRVGIFIFSLLPKNIIYIKLIMFVITLVSLFISYEVAKLRNSNNALIYPISLLSIITFSLVFFKLEDDLFSLPFLFGSLFFITKFQLSKNKKILDMNIILSLIFLFVSVLIWNYTILFILMYLFMTNFHYLYILASSVFFIFFDKFLFMILPNVAISENQPALITGNIAGGIIILLFFLYLNKNMIKENKLGIYFFSFLTLLNYKIIYILTPILLLNNLKTIENTFNNKKIMLFFIYLLFLVGTLNQIINLPPTEQEYKLFNVGQTLSKDINKEIIFPWGLGYFAIYNNFETNYYGSPPEEKIEYKNKIIINRKNSLQLKNCKLIQKSKFYQLLNCP